MLEIWVLIMKYFFACVFFNLDPALIFPPEADICIFCKGLQIFPSAPD